MNISTRRTKNFIIFFVLAAGLSFYFYKISQTLTDITIITGWTLFALMVFLAAYNARKKLTFLPIGNSNTWLQFHIYAGLLTGILFLFHIGFKVPKGQLELSMTIMYLLVFVSGVIGLIITRAFPKRLSSRSEEYIFERIPLYRKILREKAEELAVDSINTTNSSMIAEFYRDEIATFLGQPKNLIHHFWESRRPLLKILRKVDNLSRYMDETEKGYVNEMRELVIQKNDLDYTLCLQGCLKYWLFIHIPFTYSLMIFTILHVVLVYAFTGGMS
jgi:hypothetical protein